MQLLRGLAAPVIYPVAGAYGGLKLLTGSDWARSMAVIDDFVTAGCVMGVGFLGGIVAGIATAIEAVAIELHYQLWRRGDPQERPWVYRKLSDPMLYRRSAEKIVDYIYG